MTSLENIISAGVAAYQASLPDYARGPIAEPEPARPNITLTDERQIQLCLTCPLAECVDIADSRCPIRIEQRRVWRENRRSS